MAQTKRFEGGCIAAAIHRKGAVDCVAVERLEPDGMWEEVASFRKADLPRLIVALQKAYEHLAFGKDAGEDAIPEEYVCLEVEA